MATITEIKAYFSLIGDEFSPNEISEILSIMPTETFKKGDTVPGKATWQRKETSWSLGTNYDESLDINIQLDKVISQLQTKIDQINYVMEKFNLISKTRVVIRVKDNQSPAIYLDHDKIDFFHKIRSTIEFDLYVI
ncbi:DUF4279 domain-containing protein [Leptospira alexanderi]|uniref:DUF4279 domain-containing protein n=1 Tax=Leptospira alexanderi TaxID=100053 RepID=UPI00099135F5|nr:DUF4279 domain-containing protein [Leptospira alexanderi]